MTRGCHVWICGSHGGTFPGATGDGLGFSVGGSQPAARGRKAISSAGANGSDRQSGGSSSTAGVSVQAAQPARSTGANPGVASSAAPQPLSPSGQTPFDPTGVFCDRPRSRIDAAVSQGLGRWWGPAQNP
jgi:hypothetical protein